MGRTLEGGQREVEMGIQIWFRMILCILIGIGATICCCCAGLSTHSRQFAPSDLAGTWRAEYDINEYKKRGCWIEATGVETLTLKADGTYQQIYDDGKGYVYISPWNRWHLKMDRGYVYVYLEGGRFYPLGIEDAEKLASGKLFFYSDDDGTGRPFELDSTTGIFLLRSASWYIFTGEYEVTLNYPPVCDLDSPVIVKFYPVSPSPPAPTPSP